MNQITYSTNKEDIATLSVAGFFEGWAQKPSEEILRKSIEGASFVVLAIDDGRLVGYVTAISDGALSAYIPFLEVLPEYRGRGIGQELVRRILEQTKGLYMIDLVCDEHLVGFYETFGFRPHRAMIQRNYRE